MMKEKINETLLTWYKENKRDLPWRRNKDSYSVWVSEIMLQQTRVEAVRPYYERFMYTLPTLKDLALCEDDKLAKLWEGLGYYSRVRNMKKAAQVCVEKYEGQLPSTYEKLLELAGIGPYSASAIASIAFDEARLALDGNVMRVFSRLLNIEEDITLKSTQEKIYQFFKMYPCAHMGDLNQALMDFGSAICLPKNMARCNICPMQEYCDAYKNHTVYKLPVKKAKKERRKEKKTVVIYRYEKKVLLNKRADSGLLAGLYEFTTLEGHKTKKDFPKSIYLGKYTHVFSHVEWDMKGFIVDAPLEMTKQGLWVDIEDMLHTYSIPSAFSYYKESFLTSFKAYTKE